MLKILMVATGKYPIPAVLGGSIETLIQYFLAENIRKKRIHLTVYSMDHSLARQAYADRYMDAEIVYVKRTKRDDLWDKLWHVNRGFLKVFKRLLFEDPYMKRVYKDFKNKEYDYIIFEGNFYEKCSYIYRKIGREKMVIHWHAEMHGRKILSEWFYKHICISNYIARVLICNGFIRFENVYVLKDCADIDLFSQPLPITQREELLNRYRLSESDFIISFVGRTIPEKGVRELLLAFKEVCRQSPNAKLLVIGSSAFGFEDKTAYQAELIGIAEGLEDRIIFTGYLHHDEMWKILKLSSINVFPSIWNEGAGIVGIEAMAASIPMITMNVGGIPEYVDKDTSIMLDWDKNIIKKLSDSILTLMSDEKKRETMRENGYKKAQKFNISNYYDDFCDILYELDEEKNKSRLVHL